MKQEKSHGTTTLTDNTSAEGPREGKVRLLSDDGKFLSVNQVIKLFNIGRTTLYDWIKREDHPFPRPMAMSSRVTRFRVDEVEKWVEGIPEAGSLGALFGAEGDVRDG